MAKRTLSDRGIVEDCEEDEEEEEEEEESNSSRISYEEDGRRKAMLSTSSSSSAMAASFQQQQQMLRCQADVCEVDLGAAKRYHQRHKVCENHAKASVVVVGGIDQRYCQQCSRFHEISQFDNSKRSCRERLAGHNERRRKIPPDQRTEDPGHIPTILHVNDNLPRQVPVMNDSPCKLKAPTEVIKIALPRNPPIKHFQIK